MATATKTHPRADFREELQQYHPYHAMRKLTLSPRGTTRREPTMLDYLAACKREGVPLVECYPCDAPSEEWEIEVWLPEGYYLSDEKTAEFASALSSLGLPATEEGVKVDDLSFQGLCDQLSNLDAGTACEVLTALHETTGAVLVGW